MAGSALRTIAAAGLLAGCVGSACAQIYTCVDSKGRRQTSDRPIMDCIDRPQQELNSSGTVRRTLQPSLTADEIAAAEDKARRAVEARQREEDEKRRGRTLVARYPDAASHDRERATALRAVEDNVTAIRKRLDALQAENARITIDASVGTVDPGTKQRLRKQAEDIQAQMALQKRQLVEHEEEKKRLNAQFDQEMAQLKKAWAQQAGAPPAARKKP